MNKPRGIQWLEEQTGETLDPPSTTPPPKERHVSIRLQRELYEQLERVAVARGESVSWTIRRLLADGLNDIEEPTAAIDNAIAALQVARDQLAS